MMDNVKINDQIILMRKSMKTTKIYSIRKILKQIKLLQKKIDKEKNEKVQRKIERLKKEVDVIRKLDVDKVSNIALKEEKQWNKILIQRDASIEERSFARLISDKKIQEKIAQFHSENPELQKLLPSVLEKLEKRKLLKMKRTNAGKSDENNINDVNQMDGDLEHTEEVNELEGKKLNNTTDSKKSKNKQTFTKKKKLKKILNTDDELVKDSINESIKNIPTKKLSKNLEKISTEIKGSMQIVQIDLDKLDDDIFITPVVQRDASIQDLSKKKSSDSFFTNGDDDDDDIDHSDNADSDNDNEHSVSENEYPSHPNMKTQFVSSLSNSKRRNFPSKIKSNSFSKQVYNKRKEFINENKIPRKSENTLTAFKMRERDDDSNQDSNLHPSWEAKKKQKTKILPFQGKKIKFDADN